MLRPLGPPPATPAAGPSPSTGSTRQRQGGPSGPWSVHVNPDTRPRPWPLGALATTGRGFVVLSCCGRRPRAHSQRTSPAPAPHSWRPRAWPCCPGRGRACAPNHRAKHGRPTALQPRPSDARGGPEPGAQRAPAQPRLRHHGRSGTGACSPRSPGDGCPAASMEGGSGQASNPGPLLKQAGPRVPLN